MSWSLRNIMNWGWLMARVGAWVMTWTIPWVGPEWNILRYILSPLRYIFIFSLPSYTHLSWSSSCPNLSPAHAYHSGPNSSLTHAVIHTLTYPQLVLIIQVQLMLPSHPQFIELLRPQFIPSSQNYSCSNLSPAHSQFILLFIPGSYHHTGPYSWTYSSPAHSIIHTVTQIPVRGITHHQLIPNSCHHSSLAHCPVYGIIHP